MTTISNNSLILSSYGAQTSFGAGPSAPSITLTSTTVELKGLEGLFAHDSFVSPNAMCGCMALQGSEPAPAAPAKRKKKKKGLLRRAHRFHKRLHKKVHKGLHKIAKGILQLPMGLLGGVFGGPKPQASSTGSGQA
ncbi:MAG: hypothetical protein HYV07_18755 [Deltaproteobacteria bacterium]|nr:hypothetical protein [Deltaproteobacteria bacterium]